MGALATQGQDAEALAKDPKKRAVIDLINQQKPAIEVALPKHLDAERFTRIVLTEVRRTPALLRCDPMSLLGALMLSAQLGLEPGPLGHAYFIPFKNEVVFVIGYKGMIDMARRSGQISTIVARAVHEGDEFSYRYGLDDDLKHVPTDMPGPLTHVYAIAKFKDGGAVFVVLSLTEVESYHLRSPSAKAQTSPWKTDYEAMAKKTAIRRLFPFLPVTAEFAQAMTVGDEAPVKGLSADILSDLALEVPETPDEVEDAEVVEPTQEALTPA